MPLRDFSARAIHVFGRHVWDFKGFGAATGRCFWVWHCRYCATSHTRGPLDEDSIDCSGYMVFSPTWEATNRNQVGADDGVGVYVVRDKKMVRIGNAIDVSNG